VSPLHHVTRGLIPAGLALVALTGCGDGFEPYYTGSAGPQIGELEPDFELGNAGGELVTIRGAGFGDDADALVVLFDNHNAEVVSASNNEIVVRTPPGPITGGGVEVLVANPQGYDLEVPNGDISKYRYGVGAFGEDGQPMSQSAFYRGQRHYVQVSNLYDSCYGGRGTPGCEGNSFNGPVGIDGQGEFFRFAYPRLHTTALGWLTSYDASPLEWQVGPPRTVFPSGVDDLRYRYDGTFEIINPNTEGQQICVDLTEDVQFATEVCDNSFGQREYDLGVLEFCQTLDQDEGGTGQYRPDWPVNRDFFESLPGEGLDVELAAYDQGLQLFADVSLPPKVDFDAEYGFDVPTGNPWTVGSPVDCADSNEDGQVTLDEDGMILTWTPIPDTFAPEQETNTFIHVSLTLVDFAWYSLETQGVRARIVVPDNHEVGEDGLARLRVPNEVLYQIPSPNFNWSSETPQSGFLGRYDSNPSYLFMEAYRVTDYRMETGEGPLIFSYATGELTLLADYTNPLFRSDDCDDCLDGDGDGWIDSKDPDCNENPDIGGNGETEDDSLYGEFTCNDGIDNNRDGTIDAEDPLCQNGWDGESECTDGIDNDDDGWLDELDPGCQAGDFEDDAQGGTCNDGLDNDGDGWVDAMDPGCLDGNDDEDDGFIGSACNDGVDNDGHGDVDADDYYCILLGAEAESEQPAFITSCRNERDDDNDGFEDGLDPDCERPPHNRENTRFFDPEDEETVLAPGCYDGLDNDGDGTTDADDPGCWNPAFGYAPDGFISDESTSWGTTCSDGVDSDADGWIDGEDPDCVPGVSDAQTEVGFGTTQCNDGIDNDGDGDIDGADSLCSTALGNFEG